MPNTREKLIELQKQARYYSGDFCLERHCKDCPYEKYGEDCGRAAKSDFFIANGVTVQDWISVKDRLPEKMGKYVCRYVFGENEEYTFEQVLWYYTAVEKPHFQHEGSMGLRVTHWMPLPQPPKGE